MTDNAPDIARLADAVRRSPLLDEATRSYWLAVLPALDDGLRQRLASILRGEAVEALSSTAHVAPDAPK